MESKYSLFETFIQMLEQLAIDVSNCGDDKIEDNLEELDGYYYSFFHPINLEKLIEQNHINKDQSDKVLIIRGLLDKLSVGKWNKDSFINHPEWIKARQLAMEVLNSINNKSK